MSEADGKGNSLFQKMWRAAMLDVDLYEDVEADKSATGQAYIVVVISSVLAGFGTGFLTLMKDGDTLAFIVGLFAGIASATIMWGVFAWLTYFVGTRLFAGPETSADWGELLRTLGFSTAPGVIRIIPGIGSFIGSIWMIVTAVVAVRQALDFTTGRAIGTCLVCILPTLIIQGIVMGLLFALL